MSDQDRDSSPPDRRHRLSGAGMGSVSERATPGGGLGGTTTTSAAGGTGGGTGGTGETGTGAGASGTQPPAGSSMHHEPPAPPPQPPFEPLFTLLTNTTTNATVHPRVHYLFSDDDTSVLAAPQDTPQHRTLIVDLAAPAAPGAAWAIAWAASLSPEFAVTGSHLSAQQHRDGDGEDGDGDGRGGGALMLRVEGVELEPVDTTQQTERSQQAQQQTERSQQQSQQTERAPQQQQAERAQLSQQDVAGSGPVPATREDTEGLADEFRRRMGVLRKVVQEGERRRGLLDRQAEEEMEGSPDAEGQEEGSAATATATATPAIVTEAAHQ